ncbi:DUF3558 family protein [Nocardia takedensis]|uniref:DUF3558 family protein n=1 Tax=Nocardia takedensis TaxID=259390 RepID=UPI003F772689
MVVIAAVTWLGHERPLDAGDHRPVVTLEPGESGAATPPWTLAEVFDRPCAVLTANEVDRFGFASPGHHDATFDQCEWSTPETTTAKTMMYFLPGVNLKFHPYTRAFDGRAGARVLTVAGRAAHLEEWLYPTGQHMCGLSVSIASGGAMRIELEPEQALDYDVCARAIEIATVITERLR